MDSYYKTEKFQRLLQVYEDFKYNNNCGFLDAEELTDIAEYYQLIGHIQKAIDALDFALQVFPGSLSPSLLRAKIAMIEENDIEKAKTIANSIFDKEDTEYTYLIAEILLSEDKINEANQILENNIFKIEEDEQDLFYTDVAHIFADYDLYQYTEEWYQKIEDKTTEESKKLQSRILGYQQKFSESNKILNELIDINPYSTTYWKQLAINQLQEENFQEANTSIDFALAIDNSDEDAMVLKANTLIALEHYEEAMRYLYTFIETSKSQNKSFAYLTIGAIQLMHNKNSLAFKAFSDALYATQEKHEVFIQIAIALFDNGYIKNAYELLKIYLPQMGNNWNIGFAHFAKCCYIIGNEIEFKDALLKAIGQNYNECKDILGDLYEAGLSPLYYPDHEPIQIQKEKYNNHDNIFYQLIELK